ncbi:hypothetical protein EV188_110156 [Actinomycetospora succinea]|uniref:Uncharacterized protein n=1 Tax=Actinomycetospora succinea TaxID=663603 RepID=A0A4R6UW05_9PSEU|nr:hypothetical protein EV188_110156 [Actinomycetospora succinea]
MSFVHGHARESGWVMSHYRRPQLAGDDQLDLSLPAPRTGDEEDEPQEDDDAQEDGEDEPRASVFSIPRATASTR